jgi:hypothetical protein
MNSISDFRIQIEPVNEDYDPSDERWLDQVNELVDDLERDVGKVDKVEPALKDKKGGAEALILALGSAGAITAAIDMFKAWISRDQHRELVLSIERKGETQTFRVSGNRMDKNDIRQFLESALNSWTNHERTAL